MCKAVDDLIQDGKAEGSEKVIHTIRKKLQQGLQVEEIVAWMDLEESYVQEIKVINGCYPPG